jgi:hypothetical protein
MTGNKPGSHKAIKKTRSSVTKASINSKRKLNLTTPVANITAVTQTQGDDHWAPVPITASPHVSNPLTALLTVSSRLLSTLESPVADDDAISDMVSGLPLRRLDYVQTDVLVTTTETPTTTITQELLDDDDHPNTVHDESIGQVLDHETPSVVEGTTTHVIPPTNGLFPLQKIALSKFKKKTGRKGAFKLTAQSVHNALRTGVSDQLKKSIKDGVTKKGNSHTALKTSLGFFETQSYHKQVTVTTGQSQRLANKKADASRADSDLIYDAQKPTFDLKKATKAAPDISWGDVVPSFNMDSRKFRRYIVEDVMYSNPETRERLLLLVSTTSPYFADTYLRIYNIQQETTFRSPVQFEKSLYFQIEAEVVKNASRESFVHGLHDIDTVRYLLSSTGGGGIGILFPDCPASMGIELKFATVFEHGDDFQVWGMSKSGRDFKPGLRNLKNEASRDAFFTRFLHEVYGDHAQTQLLASNFNNITTKNEVDLEDNNDVSKASTDMSTLGFGGDSYNDFVQHVDGVFEEAVKACYGRFVSLSEPIISQQAIVRLVDMFKRQFPSQYSAISMLLNYDEHKKRNEREHLTPFYDRMIFYQFMSLCRVRCHKTFTWWGLVNACMRYGSSVNSAISGLDAVFFGHSLVPMSVMRKTKEHRTIDEDYYDRIRHTLWDVPISCSIVDNTQLGFPLCNQRNGVSNHFVKMTAKTFVELQFFWATHNLMLARFNYTVAMTYMGQIIKSPYGMPCYETLTHKSLAYAMQSTDEPDYNAVHDMDITGERVVAHRSLIMLSEELKSQERFISRPKANIKFVPEIFAEVLDDTGIAILLRPNRSFDGLYRSANKFQRRSVIKWRGEKDAMKLMPCPLSVDDETKTEECGNMAYLADESGSSKFNWIMSTLAKDSSTSMYNNRLEYRLMKKGCWIAPQGPP